MQTWRYWLSANFTLLPLFFSHPEKSQLFILSSFYKVLSEFQSSWTPWCLIRPILFHHTQKVQKTSNTCPARPFLYGSLGDMTKLPQDEWSWSHNHTCFCSLIHISELDGLFLKMNFNETCSSCWRTCGRGRGVPISSSVTHTKSMPAIWFLVTFLWLISHTQEILRKIGYLPAWQ